MIITVVILSIALGSKLPTAADKADGPLLASPSCVSAAINDPKLRSLLVCVVCGSGPLLH